MVLVDPSHPEMLQRAAGVPSARTMARSYNTLAGLGRLGLLRLLGPVLLGQLLAGGERVFPAATWQSLRYLYSRSPEYAAAAREAASGEENFAAARGAPGCLGDLPLEVLSAEWWASGKPSQMKQSMLGLVKDLPAYSTRGQHRMVTGCDHSNLPVVRADAVAEAVGRVLEMAGR
jgi:hypothetical protein